MLKLADERHPSSAVGWTEFCHQGPVFHAQL